MTDNVLGSLLALGTFVLSAVALWLGIRQNQATSRRTRAQDQADHDAKVERDVLERARVDGIEQRLDELRRQRGEAQ